MVSLSCLSFPVGSVQKTSDSLAIDEADGRWAAQQPNGFGVGDALDLYLDESGNV